MEETLILSSIDKRIFVVAGMPRGGTTFLYQNLGKHPSVFMPFRKESNYFCLKNDKGLKWFLGLYEGMRENQVGFDIAPAYFLSKDAIKRMKEFNPELKVILSLRDPVEFALSMYTQFNTYKWNVPSFKSYLEHYDYNEGNSEIEFSLKSNFVVDQLNSYREAFGDNLLIYDFALFKKDPLMVLQAIESFVGIPKYFSADNFENRPINAGNRRNVKMVSYLLSREQFISVLNFIIPRRTIQTFSNLFTRISKAKGGTSKQSYSEEDLRLAEEALGAQRAPIDDIFAEHKIQLGSGKPFP